MIALYILRPLLHPEGDVRLRHCRGLAPVPMPKASAHVDDCFCPGNYNVGFAPKSLVAHLEPPTAGKEPFADKHFRQCVLAANLCHQPAALLRSESIHNVRPLKVEFNRRARQGMQNRRFPRLQSQGNREKRHPIVSQGLSVLLLRQYRSCSVFRCRTVGCARR